MPYNQVNENYFFTGRRKYDFVNIIFHTAGYSFYPDYEWLATCRLENLDRETKYNIKTKIRQSVTFPRDTSIYKLAMDENVENERLEDILQDLERGGLRALGLLGETDVLPRLVSLLMEMLESKGNVGVSRRLLLWVNFSLKFLVGQCSKVEYAISREERLKRNLSALERIPFETRFKLSDLADWDAILRNAKKRAKAVTSYAQDNNKRHLELAGEVWLLWDELEQWMPCLEFEPLWFFPLLEPKLALKEWTANLDCLVRLPEPIDYALPVDFQDIEVWSDLLPLDSNYGLLEARDIDGSVVKIPYLNRYEALWPYWSYLYGCFRTMWQLSSRATLEGITWQVDTRTVKMTTVYHLPIQSVEELDVKGSDDVYWTIAFQSGQPAYVSAVSNAILLNLQMLMLRGGNKFRPVEVGDGRLAIELQILRANTMSSLPSPDPLPENVIEQVTYHILSNVLPGYTKVSQELESMLLSELERIRPYISPFHVPEIERNDSLSSPYFEDPEQELFYNLEWVVEELVWLRETFVGHLKVLDSVI